MFQLSASVNMVLPEQPLPERIRLLQRTGLGVGLWDPSGLDLDEVCDSGAHISIMDGFGTGSIALAETVDDMLSSAEAMIPIAQRLGTPLMNLHGAKLTAAGPAAVPVEDVTSAMRETAVESLRRFAELGERHDVIFGLENLNPIDHPGVPFSSGADVIDLVDEVDSPHLRMNFDVYHAARSGESIQALLPRAVELAAEIQLADAPTRHWPGERRIDFAAIATQIADLGYRGSVALEAWILQDAGSALEEFITLFGKEAE